MTERFKCRVCNGYLTTVLDLGTIYPSGFLSKDQEPGRPEPLVLTRCDLCGLAQLKHTINPDSMYRNYWYKSSLNPSMLRSLQDVVDSTLARYKGDSGIVVDIGANDGSMLSMFPEDFVKVGFDPALNLREEAEGRCNVFVNDYFHLNAYPLGDTEADIVTAIAMFYDLDNPNEFLIDVSCILAADGIFVVQMTDLVSMLRSDAFDNICHEHLCYYSLRDMIKLFKEHGLEIFDVEYNDVNGGSIRIFASRPGVYEVSKNVAIAGYEEGRFMSDGHDDLFSFSVRVMNTGFALMKYISRAVRDGWSIYGLGASTKGNTLLQYLELNNTLIRAIGEVNEDKFNKRTVGTNIPILPEKIVLKRQPDVLLILPWHFRSFFIEKLKGYLDNGGTLLFPLPYPETVTIRDGELHTYRLQGAPISWPM